MKSSVPMRLIISKWLLKMRVRHRLFILRMSRILLRILDNVSSFDYGPVQRVLKLALLAFSIVLLLSLIPAPFAAVKEYVPFYGDFVWQGAYIFNISPEGIELRGTITHIDEYGSQGSSYWSYSEYFVERALYIEDVLYTVSGKLVKLNDLESLVLLEEIELS